MIPFPMIMIAIEVITDHRIDIRRVIPSPTRDCILLPHNCNLAILTYFLLIHHLSDHISPL